MERFTSVAFRNFKAFKNYSVSLGPFNVLVGPNNAGKSTIITAFRILSEAMRKARAKTPEIVLGPNGREHGYHVNLTELPGAAENIFSDYDDSNPATIDFRISNGNRLLLYFPEREVCLLFANTAGKPVRTTTAFRTEYDCDVSFVPVLGPVEHDEQLFQKEAARLALVSHRAARNFRNIWFHYPERFDEFRDLLRRTWPGMDIERPKADYSGEKPRLHMFCLEGRIPRELFWSGFGFQVWCQMLTYIVAGSGSSILAIDEPDIYLHSDLQRQLLSILKDAGPDILVATHSTELVSEADPTDILVVTAKAKSAKRLKDPGQLQTVFRSLGSNLNPTLTQLAKSRRALFVEGRDFHLISLFADRLGKSKVANRAPFAVIPAEGFQPQKVVDVSAGIETTLGTPILRGVVFDRDYRSAGEVTEISNQLKENCHFVHIHGRKEIENFLLVPSVLERAVRLRLEDRRKRTGEARPFEDDLRSVLSQISETMRIDVQSKLVTQYTRFQRTLRRGVDESTLMTEAIAVFERDWADLESRLRIVPGKDVFAKLNQYLMDRYEISLSIGAVVRAFAISEIPPEMVELVKEIDAFGAASA